jgi:riboflavin kinase/FMN adenylyltransferase
MKTATSIGELKRYGITDIVIACGVFDGVHRGHRALISALLKLALKTGHTPVVVTFSPHPRSILQPDSPPQYLTVEGQKLRLLKELGVVGTVLLPFSRAMAALPPHAFLDQEMLSSEVRVHGICVGKDWRFGAGGSGDTRYLEHAGQKYGFVVRTVPEITWYKSTISSTRIRQAIRRGRMQHARNMLGRPYRVCGRVVSGKGLGNPTLHCPTANLADPDILLPPNGVYAARNLLFETGDQEPRNIDGIVYIGSAPTFHPSGDAPETPILELHLFDFGEDIYGREIEVEFHEFIRKDETFASVADLRRQIRVDIATAKAVLAR